MVELASVFVSNRDVDVVNVFVAERESSFPKHFEENWKNNFYESLIKIPVIIYKIGSTVIFIPLKIKGIKRFLS